MVERKARPVADRGLPHNWETERATLGAVLLAPETLAEIREILTVEDFHRPAHQHIFALACGLADAGSPPDTMVMLDEIERRGDAERCGGVAYVIALPQACASVDNIATYANRVREEGLRRRLLLAARQTEADILEGFKPLVQLVAEAEAATLGLGTLPGQGEPPDIADVVADTLREVDAQMENPGSLRGLATGFPDLDRKLAGLQKTDLIILAARPAMGKTALVLNIATNVAKQGAGVGIFSLEMGRVQLVSRLMCAEGRVDAGAVRLGELSHQDRLSLGVAGRDVAAFPLRIDDTSGLTLVQLRAKAKRMQTWFRRRGQDLGLLVIDYLQLMQGSGAKGQNRENVISEISRGLKVLAKELDVPIIALSQLNRSLESRTDKRPMPSDLRESGAIEQDADVILFIYRDEVYNKEATAKRGIAEVIVAKQRGGSIGTVELAFLDHYVLFQSLARQGEGYV